MLTANVISSEFSPPHVVQRSWILNKPFIAVDPFDDTNGTGPPIAGNFIRLVSLANDRQRNWFDPFENTSAFNDVIEVGN